MKRRMKKKFDWNSAVGIAIGIAITIAIFANGGFEPVNHSREESSSEADISGCLVFTGGDIIEKVTEGSSAKNVVETKNSFSKLDELYSHKNIMLTILVGKNPNEEISEDDIEEENSLSEDEILLAQIVFAEAGNQPFEGQVAVAATVLNRINSSIYPNTVRGVIFQKEQFSPVKNGKIYAGGKVVTNVPESCVQAAMQALAGDDPTEELLRQEAARLGLNADEYAGTGALGFYNPDAISSQSEKAARDNIKCKVKIGQHIFYYKFG